MYLQRFRYTYKVCSTLRTGLGVLYTLYVAQNPLQYPDRGTTALGNLLKEPIDILQASKAKRHRSIHESFLVACKNNGLKQKV